MGDLGVKLAGGAEAQRHVVVGAGLEGGRDLLARLGEVGGHRHLDVGRAGRRRGQCRQSQAQGGGEIQERRAHTTSIQEIVM